RQAARKSTSEAWDADFIAFRKWYGTAEAMSNGFLYSGTRRAFAHTIGAYMTGKTTVLSILALAGSAGVWAQPTPIYQVTVIERTVKAVDYQYKNGPTKIDFRGTVLLPHAKGEAVVESKAGRTEIAVKFERVEAASRFGAEYL